MFKTNHFGFGFILGLISQLIMFTLIYFTNHWLIENQSIKGLDLQTIILTSIFLNIILLRIYFLNLKLEKSGYGILIATFLTTAIAFTLVSLL